MSVFKTPSILLLAAVCLLLVWNCSRNDSTDEQAEVPLDQLGKLTIEYPLDGAMFPLEIAPSAFIWKDESGKANSWFVKIGQAGATPIIETLVTEQKWKPDSETWMEIKTAALGKPVSIAVFGTVSGAAAVSGAKVSIQASSDPVGAPIFFREVPLPFDYANQYPEKIRYRLGYVSELPESKVLLDNLPLCGNCHSFSRDGSVFGMDVDYANDKGSYVLTELEKQTDLTPDKIITWSDYKKEDKELTFGLLSRVSPDGRHVVSTVKDRSIFVGLPENLAYSQLFFPIKGIIVSYDRQTETFKSLKGADDPDYVQSNPSWSPDGKTLFYARSQAYHLKNAEGFTGAIIPREAAAEFLENNKKFKYDIYKVPFNEGEGGEPIPLKGASNNGKSNFFPKVTPDGKWVVFTQAESFMLLQPDSRLYIVPAGGGEAREMNCNTSAMNSWHSFSPNGRWMVFSSKARGPYTQLWLSHLDENGNDTPPVLLEHLMTEERAANIPEFLNVASGSVEKLVDQFSEGGNYHYRVAKNLARYGDLKGALHALDRAVETQPNNPDVFLERGALHSRLNNNNMAVRDFEKAIAVAPEDFRGPFNLALVKEFMGDLDGASSAMDKSVELSPKNYHVLGKRALLNQKLGDNKGALAVFDKAIALSPNSANLYNLRGDIRRELDDFDGAFSDFANAIALQPDLGSAWLNRSYAYLSRNDWDSAEKDLRMAKKYVPDAPLGYVIEALIAFKKGNPVQGCSIMQEALSNGHTTGYEDQVETLYRQTCRP
jgi:tetratricopeptide (TPR) repeat protein